MVIKPELIKELAKEIKTQDDLFGPKGILKQLTKHLLEAALEGELTHHLGYEKHGKSHGENARNGYSAKQVQSEHGCLELEVPRDRQSTFEPVLVPKRQNRIAGLDDKVIALYARGLSTRDIQAQLEEMYGVEISSGLITAVTDAVIDEVRAWQCRPLESVSYSVFGLFVC